MTTDDKIRIGIIGGSGLYDIDELTDCEEREIETPFGKPSAPYVVGSLRGQRVAFLARHGKGHSILPSELNFRANIYGLKHLGAEWIVSASAVGSLQEKYRPKDIVVPDQFFDRTRGRVSTFFGEGLVAHVSFANPLCPVLSELAVGTAKDAGATVHQGGTYLCMEGPQFSTLAESNLYRSWGCDVIGMTNMPEAKLAREAEIPYCTVAMVTDYDCWHPDHDNVEVDTIIRVLLENAEKARSLVKKLAPKMKERPAVCPSGDDRALEAAMITAPEARDPAVLKTLDAVAGRVLSF